MKSFKQMMAEVAQPEPEEEKEFKAQHKVVVNKHPVALDHQHTGEIAKPKAKRKADQEGDAAYDMAYESVEKLDELSKKTLGNYVKKSAADMSSKDSLDMHKGAMKRYKGIVKATDRLTKESTDLTENPQEEIPMMMNQLAFICYAAEEMSGMMKLGGDPEEWFQNKLAAVHGEMKSLYSYMQGESQMGESVMAKRDALDKAAAPSKEGKKAVTLKKAPWDKNEELSPKQKKIDHNKNGKIDGHDLAMIRAKKNEASCGTTKKMKEEVELDETTNSALKKPVTMTGPDGKTRTVMKTTKANTTDDNGQDKIQTRESVETLDEAFKAGIVKFKDNTSMVLKKEDADVLNALFKKMSSGSVKKMSETAMANKKGFAEILDFAKEAM